jgi:hypothetical protein
MKAIVSAFAFAAAATAGPAAAAPWGYPSLPLGVQAEKARSSDYRRPEAPTPPRRSERPQREERRDQAFTEDERRALHRDIDKANRELYRRRGQ